MLTDILIYGLFITLLILIFLSVPMGINNYISPLLYNTILTSF